MSDYFQILQREKNTKKNKSDNKKVDGNLNIEKKLLKNNEIKENKIKKVPNTINNFVKEINKDEKNKVKIIENNITNQSPIKEKNKTIDKDNNNSNKIKETTILTQSVDNIIWLSVSESSKMVGVQNKTLRRAIKLNRIKYKVVNNRYSLDFQSLISYMLSTTKLKNKLNQHGIGQYIKLWKE